MTTSGHKIELNAEPRTVLGRKVKTLRNSGYIPAVLYGKGQEPISLKVPEKDFMKVLKEAGESTLVYLNVDGENYPTIIHDVAKDHINDHIIHTDFYKVSLTEKVKTKVPLQFIGESPAVRDSGGIFVRNINELEVEALPQNLPHEITVNITSLNNFGDKILLKDLKKGLGSLVELTAIDEETIIATVQEPISEEKLQESLAGETADVSEVEIGKKKEEGEEGEEVEETAGETPQKVESEPKKEE